MPEQCGKCNQTAKRVIIAGRGYCAACGEAGSLTPNPSRSMRDVGTRVSAVSARPATSLHQRAMAKGGVLDLRSAQQPSAKIIPARRPSKAAIPQDAKAASHKADSAPIIPAIPRSQSISRFHSRVHQAPAIPKTHIPPATKPELAKLPAPAETHHRAVAKLAAKRPSHHIKSAPTTSLSRYAAVAAAVAIMSGYVWLQNYPKLELHSASSKAGFALTLPSFIPSSYTLSGPVQASNGAATLSFKSPSAPDPLKITQKVTTWDSSSLRDNVVSVKNPDFTAVEGQGLTIYLWGKNQAAWVNHGIWYGIEGASNLSREQLLKIAYSL